MLAGNRSCRIRIVSADVASVLSELALAGIELYQVETTDCVTAEVSIENRAIKTVKRILVSMGISCKIVKRQRSIWETDLILKRIVLAVGLVLFLIAGILISNRVLFVEVIGNSNVSSQEILMRAEEIGISFFARAKDVRSEECKNKLLENIPQLQWLGITIKGCVATIRVQERSIYPEINPKHPVVSGIVSVCDGVITDQTVYRGNPLFQVGDAVKKGDMLVSGYVDCGLKQLAGRASAEVYALTMREYQFFYLKPSASRGKLKKTHTCYQLRIGKKVINFCNHSGIMDATCVKMYSEYYWTLPGGFQLPVSVIKVECSFHEAIAQAQDHENREWLLQYARNYLQSQMIAGEVLDESLIWNRFDDYCVLNGSYACHEMIGQVKYEEILEQYAEDN